LGLIAVRQAPVGTELPAREQSEGFGGRVLISLSIRQDTGSDVLGIALCEAGESRFQLFDGTERRSAFL
jgi:hypothetical protein